MCLQEAGNQETRVLDLALSPLDLLDIFREITDPLWAYFQRHLVLKFPPVLVRSCSSCHMKSSPPLCPSISREQGQWPSQAWGCSHVGLGTPSPRPPSLLTLQLPTLIPALHSPLSDL